MVVVPDEGQVAELLSACKRGGFSGDAFFETAVASERVDVRVEDGFAEGSFRIQQAVHASRCHCEADGGSNAGAERAGGDFDALGVAVLRVTRGQGPCGAQGLEVIELKADAC
ncbi:Uncharacterised protein [Chlamydia trachomatis]|nr:Uncharacterised protein [Chlamydia trachomatis]